MCASQTPKVRSSRRARLRAKNLNSENESREAAAFDAARPQDLVVMARLLRGGGRVFQEVLRLLDGVDGVPRERLGRLVRRRRVHDLF